MNSKKNAKSPRPRDTTVLFFLLGAAALIIGGYFLFGALTRLNYSNRLPEDAPLRITVPDSYVTKPIQDGPATPAPAATPTPMPMRTIAPTPIPLDSFSLYRPDLVLPSAESIVPGKADLFSFRVSDPDQRKAVEVRGWGYLLDQDAALSDVYLVVSTNYGYDHRLYEVERQPGASGVIHDPAHGQNLDQADFQAIFNVETYADGAYKLGVAVFHGKGVRQLKGFYPLGSEYDFWVERGKVR